MSKCQTSVSRNTKKAKMMAGAEAQYIQLTGDMADRQTGRIMTPINVISSVNYRKQYKKWRNMHEPWQYGWFARECDRMGVMLRGG